MKKLYNKRLNVLIHGLEENVESSWKKPNNQNTHVFEGWPDNNERQNKNLC